MMRYRFRLYITGETGRSRRAVDNLRTLCDERVPGHYELLIVDVLVSPDLAEENRIIATPTAIKLVPPPERRVIGDLSDLGLAASALDLPDRPVPMPGGG
jgi:circadian clock protein KaiB